MKNIELIERVLERQEFTVAITGLWGESTRVNVTVPDLRSAPRTVWGDWGPMYIVSIPANQAIEVSVRPSTGGVSVIHDQLDVRRLHIDSPMLADVRAVTPLVMKLPLPQDALRLRVFYDAIGQPAKAELGRSLVAANQDAYEVSLVDRAGELVGGRVLRTVGLRPA